ncbi:MAG: hypothetical protein PHX18_07020 [Candidatus Gastranaerophilales bacterium]|nr:hypothetical protein [Candidatus Gastranaerophilales bacterium]
MAIPKCPLMSAGGENIIVCQQEDCAWYMKNFKSCSIYILAHEAALNIKEKQTKQG